MNRFFCMLLALAYLLACRAEVLSIDQCVELARARYPAIAQYGLIEQTEHYDLQNAAKAWLPQGSVSTQLTWQNDVASWPEQFAAMLAQQGMNFPGMDKTQYRIGVDVNQQIWDGGRTSASRRTIQSATEVERRSLDVQLYDVEGRVQDLYFGILLLNGKISNIDKSILLVDSTLTCMKSMLRNGVAMQSDCDQVEAKLLILNRQREQAVATRNSYCRVLEIFIGQPLGNRDLILPKEEPAAQPRRPQLSLFDAQLRHIASQESAVKSTVMPNIGAFVSAYYGYPGYNMFKNMQNHAPSFNFMAGLKISWNFGSLYTHGNSLHKLQLQRQQIENNRETFLFNNRMAETEGASQIAALQKVMENDERIVALRQSVIRAAQSQLRNGVIDATALLAKVTDAELAENDLILHNIELIKAKYSLNHIRNK